LDNIIAACVPVGGGRKLSAIFVDRPWTVRTFTKIQNKICVGIGRSGASRWWYFGDRIPKSFLPVLCQANTACACSQMGEIVYDLYIKHNIEPNKDLIGIGQTGEDVQRSRATWTRP
jgi:hypothetical protein